MFGILPHLISFQDKSGTWHDGGPLPTQGGIQSSFIVTVIGTDKKLQVIGLGVDYLPYLISAQDADGKWYEGMPLPTRSGAGFESILAVVGTDGNLQVIGVDASSIAFAPYLISLQDRGGTWRKGIPLPNKNGIKVNPPSILAVTGADQKLQVIGLNIADGVGYLISSQDATGTWHDGMALPNNTHAVLSSILAVMGADGTLQVLGLGASLSIYDNLPFLISRQDKSGAWHEGDMPLPGNIRVQSIVTVMGADQKLQVLGLGLDDNLPYLISVQDTTGTWHPGGPLVPDQSMQYSSILAVMGADRTLQVLGLGLDDNLPYLMRWQDMTGTWHEGMALTNRSGTRYSSILAVMGADQKLQILGLGLDDNLAYLVSVQDGTGIWHDGMPLPDKSGAQFSSILAVMGADKTLQVIGGKM